MLLVVTCAPVVLEPVDKHLEWLMVDLMEVESSRTNLDELLENLILSDIADNDMLRVSCQDSKAVGDTSRLIFLLLLETSLKVLESLSIRELLMAYNLAN